MISTAKLPDKEQTRDDDLMHVVCAECSPDDGLCGTHVEGPLSPDDALVGCVVCAALEYLPCPRCGY